MSKELSQEFINNFYKAESLFKENNFLDSLKIYESLLKENPEHVSVLNNIGLIYERLKKLDKAKILYKKCNTIIPNQIEILHNLANVYFKLKEYKEALPILQKIINPNFKYEVNCEKIAQCLFVIQTKKETKKFIDSVLPKFPNNKLLNILLGKSLLHLNLHSRGLEYIQKNEGIIEFSESGVKYFQ